MEVNRVGIQPALIPNHPRQTSDPSAGIQPTQDGAKARPPRFDEYVKGGNEAVDSELSGKEAEEKPKITKCTVNTDKVDAEIKKLTEKRQAIQQQLQQAETPEEKEKLQQQLANIETELRAKDNDAYRKQNATFTYGN